jgi:molybdopterin-synthase adenylyltransferase
MGKYSKGSRYFKQALLREIGEEGQEHLAGSSVLIAGCGALGTVIANSMVRSGVGYVRIVDRDFIELDNLPRQMLFDEEDIRKGLPKAVAAAEKLRLINSEIKIEPIVADLNSENIEELISDVDIVLDGTDNFETRFLINNACIKHNKPWIYGGVMSMNGMCAVIIPGETPCLQCLISDIPPPGTMPTCDTVGVLGMAVNIIASVESVEAVKILAGRKASLLRKLVFIDPWEGQYHLFEFKKTVKRCPVCDDHEYKFLEKSTVSHISSLCGQNAVQISALFSSHISFPVLAERLSASGDVSFNEYMLKFKTGGYELVIFPDSRAIVRGTDNISIAKTLYSKYIGS